MKKIGKIILFFSLFLLFFTSTPFSKVNADMGPKPASYITIKGIEGDYVAAFASKEVSYANFDYETYLEHHFTDIDYNPIMKYEDDEGYKWITMYENFHGEGVLKLTYYCPKNFKIIIYKNGEFYKASEAIDMYAYSSYFTVDFSNNTVVNSYNYLGEVFYLLLRIILTLAIEIGLFFLMRLYTKRNFNIVLFTNLATQIILNVTVNLFAYYSGWLSGIFALFIAEFFVLLIEFVAYQILLKEKHRLLIIAYPILANLLSFGLGILLLVS